MAMYPCDRGPHINPGRNSLFYVSVGAGNDFDRWKLRLCTEHTALVQDYLAQQEVGLIQLAGGITDAHTHCLTCRQPLLEAGYQLFVTGYPTKDEREDYWARVHERCQVDPMLAPPDDLFGKRVDVEAPVPRVPGRYAAHANGPSEASREP